MREDLLHFIWKYKKLQLTNLITSKNESVSILDVGLHNHLAGPDFFNAKIAIAEQLWAGNVEIHVKSSDWYVHAHQKDSNYDNVILHVVWEDDATVFRKDGSEIPSLELKNYISNKLLYAYQNLFDRKEKAFINCENHIAEIDTFIFQNWLERLYLERLEQKSERIRSMLKASKNDWEQVLFAMLMKNFGLKINGDAFLTLAKNLDFSLVRKLSRKTHQLESVFFGMSHVLEDNSISDRYYIDLQEEYQFLKKKFDLENEGVLKPNFFKLRPRNFPTIRLSQLANLYGKHQNLMDKIIEAKSLEDFYKLFSIYASDYWNTHYTFGKLSKKSPKKLTKSFINLLIINTIIPIKFCHAKQSGKDINESIVAIISKIKTEDNSIISNFKKNGIITKNARDSQAILQLYTVYCSQHKCLECAVGSTLLHGND